jgi:hypothetical protein
MLAYNDMVTFLLLSGSDVKVEAGHRCGRSNFAVPIPGQQINEC